MYWYGTSILSLGGMEENLFLWLHRLQLCLLVAVSATNKINVMKKTDISTGKHSWKKTRRRDRIQQTE